MNNVNEDGSFRERSYDEDNEEMMIVRGNANENLSDEKSHNVVKMVDHSWNITEFSLCDYYLVRGNEHKFQVYSLTKKRGKLTGGVSNVLFSYDEQIKHIRIGKNKYDNLLNISSDVKLQTILMFSASLCGLLLSDVVDVEKLSKIASEEFGEYSSVWKIMKMIDRVWKNK